VVAAVERWVLARVDHTLVVVEESRDRLLGLGVPADRITVVGNTPSLSRLAELTPKIHDHRERLELVYLGLLEAPRGIGILIDALASARHSGTRARLAMEGSASISRSARAIWA
jgi:hypothetical protein